MSRATHGNDAGSASGSWFVLAADNAATIGKRAGCRGCACIAARAGRSDLPVELRTYQVNFSGEPAEGAPANVELRLVDRAGNPRFNRTVQTNEIGHAT